jgi:hypothetical protein
LVAIFGEQEADCRVDGGTLRPRHRCQGSSRPVLVDS